VNPDSGDQTGRIPAIWPEWPDLARTSQPKWPVRWIDLATISRPEQPDSSGFGKIPPVLCRIPVVLARIRPTQMPTKLSEFRPFISDSGYSSQNPVKVAGILLVSDGISSPLIFILFYINIYMF